MGLQFPFPFIDVLRLPVDAGPNQPHIILDGINGTITVFDSSGFDKVSITAVPPDITIDGRSIGRGMQFVLVDSTANDAVRAPGVNTDMVSGGDFLAGRIYGVHLHSQVSCATGGFNAIECTFDGTAIGQFFANTITAGGDSTMIDSWVVFEQIAADNALIRVRNNAASSGNITLLAGADNHRTLSVHDLGSAS